LLAKLLDNVHSCSRHGVVAERLTSERPGSVTRISTTFTLLGHHTLISARLKVEKVHFQLWWRVKETLYCWQLVIKCHSQSM